MPVKHPTTDNRSLFMTYVTDPIGDLLTRMRNAQKVKHAICRAPFSKLKQKLLLLLKEEGLIADVQIVGDVPKQDLEVTFHPERQSLTLKRISKPGRRDYRSVQELKPVLDGFGIAIITTSQGLLTDKQARAKNVGGEVLCTVS